MCMNFMAHLNLKRLVLYCLFLLSASINTSFAQETPISIIPIPVSMEAGTGIFTLSNETSLIVPAGNPEVDHVANYFSTKIKPATGFDLKVSETAQEGVRFTILAQPDNSLGMEGYRLVVN